MLGVSDVTARPTRPAPPVPAGGSGRLGRSEEGGGRVEGADLVVSLAAGAEAWSDGDTSPQPLALAEALAIGAALSWPVILVTTGVTPATSRHVALLAVMLLAGFVLMAPLLAVVVHRLPNPTTARPSPTEPGEASQPSILRSSLVTSSALRVSCALVAVVCGAGIVPTGALGGAWPVGLALGLDLVRTGGAIGLTIEPAVFLRRVLVSPAHLGVLVGVLAVLVADPSGIDRGRIVALYLTAVLIVAVGAMSVAIANLDIRRMRAMYEGNRRRVVAEEFRSRGHWLHDDVCSELRLTRLRLDSGALAVSAVMVELDELDHRLRLRQLDEFIEAGSVRVAEVVQPFLRRVQQQGVVIEESPSVETAGRFVDATVARCLRRFLGVTIANALQAGATRLAVRVRWEDDALVVEVTDDAGGLPAGALRVGGGLDGLRAELGEARLDLVNGASGLTARLTLSTTTTAGRTW